MGKGEMTAGVWGMVIMVGFIVAGCDSLRFAPGEVQKQNAYLHHRTVQAAATKAQDEEVSSTLQGLTDQAARQSESIVAFYGLPHAIPASETVAEILSEDNGEVTRQARAAALERPDPWDVADNLLELGIALAGVVGGVYGMRAVGALNVARQKSAALREVIQDNELFKSQSPQSTETFKQAHDQQSTETRALVAGLK